MKQLTLIILLFAAMQTGRAQVVGTPYVGEYAPCTSMGTDFWMTFQNNSSVAATAVYLALNIAAQIPTTVTIRFTTNGDTYTYEIGAGATRVISLHQMVSDGSPTGTATKDERTGAYIPDGFSGVSNNTMRITATAPVSVYAFNTNFTTSDATVVYPVATWGTDYYQISYAPLNGVSYYGNEIIIANQNSTTINTYNGTATLSAGQVYVSPGNIPDATGQNPDLTGFHFTSTKPVAYFAGVNLLYVPAGVTSADVLDEQMPPTNMWDTLYFVPNVPQFSNPSAATNNRIRIVSAKNGTVVKYAGASLPASFSTAGTTGNNQIASGGTLDAGQWVELAINSNTNTGGAYITASNPVGVAGYIPSRSNGGGIAASGTNTNGATGDPDNAIIPGLNQMVQLAVISPFIPSNVATSGATSNLNNAPPNSVHGAIIVSPTATKNSVVMTRAGNPTNLLNGTSWVDDPNGSNTSSYYYTFSNTADNGASFIVASPGGIFVLAYGLGYAESYYYNAGSGASCRVQ